MGETDPPDSSGGTKIVTTPGGMAFDKSRVLLNDSPGEKILVMKRKGEDAKMDGASPFLITKAVEGIAQGPVNKISWLRDGTIQIKTKDFKQAKQLVRLVGLTPEIKVDVSEHPRLNFSKGVIRSRLLKLVTDDEFLREMKNQHVVEIHRIKRKENNAEIETGTYFLTFGTCEPPTSIKMCYEVLEVRAFTPSPMRCWNCLKFSHTKKYCKATKNCSNCGLEYHLVEETDECNSPPKCVNCAGEHSSLDRNCPIYLMHKEINAIMVQKKLPLREARILWRENNPEITYASVVSQNNRQEAQTQQQQQQLQQQLQQLQQLLQQQIQQNQILQQKVEQQQIQIQQLLQQQLPNNQQQQSLMEVDSLTQQPTDHSPTVQSFKENLAKLEGKLNKSKIEKIEKPKTLLQQQQKQQQENQTGNFSGEFREPRAQRKNKNPGSARTRSRSKSREGRFAKSSTSISPPPKKSNIEESDDDFDINDNL